MLDKWQMDTRGDARPCLLSMGAGCHGALMICHFLVLSSSGCAQCGRERIAGCAVLGPSVLLREETPSARMHSRDGLARGRRSHPTRRLGGKPTADEGLPGLMAGRKSTSVVFLVLGLCNGS
jgi:hypothetical protein